MSEEQKQQAEKISAEINKLTPEMREKALWCSRRARRKNSQRKSAKYGKTNAGRRLNYEKAV